MRLGKKFKQGSILFVDSDGIAYIYYTSENNSNGKPVGSRDEAGKFSANTLAEYYSKTGKEKFSLKSVSEATKRSAKFFDNWQADRLNKFMEKYGDDWEYHFCNDGIEEPSERMKKILKAIEDEEED